MSVPRIGNSRGEEAAPGRPAVGDSWSIRGVTVVSATLALGIAAGSFVISFTTLTDLARMSGAIAPHSAPVLAVVVDLFLVQATVGLLHAAQSGDRKGRRYWRATLGVFAGLSTIGNGYHAIVAAQTGQLPEVVSAAIAMVAPLALVASTHGLVVHLWGGRVPHGSPAMSRLAFPDEATDVASQGDDESLTPALVLASDPREHALTLVAAGATHGEAARAVGVDRSTVSRWASKHAARVAS